MKKLLFFALSAVSLFCAYGESLEDAVDKVERMIEKTYRPGSLANEVARKKLSDIIGSSKSEEEQVSDLHAKFPKAFPEDKTPVPEAIQSLRDAAEKGEPEAQYKLGVCYANGDGVEKDLKQAAYWWRKAAEQGFAPAQLNLGFCYYNGEDVEKDLKQAAYYRKQHQPYMQKLKQFLLLLQGMQQYKLE